MPLESTPNPPIPNLKTRLRRWLLTGFLFLAGAAALAWVLDFAVFEIRVEAKWNPYGSYTVDHYYAIPQKSGKTQLIFDPPAPQTCVNALFPHQGWLPCWYLKGHTDQRTNM